MDFNVIDIVKKLPNDIYNIKINDRNELAIKQNNEFYSVDVYYFLSDRYEHCSTSSVDINGKGHLIPIWRYNDITSIKQINYDIELCSIEVLDSEFKFPWLSDYYENIDRLNDMLALEDNWDGYGSIKPKEEIINYIKDTILPMLYLQPEVFPTVNGGIQIEYAFGRNHLNIEFLSTTKFSIFKTTENNPNRKPVTGTIEIEILKSIIDDFITNYIHS